MQKKQDSLFLTIYIEQPLAKPSQSAMLQINERWPCWRKSHKAYNCRKKLLTYAGHLFPLSLHLRVCGVERGLISTLYLCIRNKRFLKQHRLYLLCNFLPYISFTKIKMSITFPIHSTSLSIFISTFFIFQKSVLNLARHKLWKTSVWPFPLLQLRPFPRNSWITFRITTSYTTRAVNRNPVGIVNLAE